MMGSKRAFKKSVDRMMGSKWAFKKSVDTEWWGPKGHSKVCGQNDGRPGGEVEKSVDRMMGSKRAVKRSVDRMMKTRGEVKKSVDRMMETRGEVKKSVDRMMWSRGAVKRSGQNDGDRGEGWGGRQKVCGQNVDQKDFWQKHFTSIRTVSLNGYLDSCSAYHTAWISVSVTFTYFKVEVTASYKFQYEFLVQHVIKLWKQIIWSLCLRVKIFRAITETAVTHLTCTINLHFLIKEKTVQWTSNQ